MSFSLLMRLPQRRLSNIRFGSHAKTTNSKQWNIVNIKPKVVNLRQLSTSRPLWQSQINDSNFETEEREEDVDAEEETIAPDVVDKGSSLLPHEVVAELDRFIIGQTEAKKAVAIALRNRWRRKQLEPQWREEIIPKNILMIGPTGVGKTEIARRLAKLQQAPFIKVEATKFTEVGFHGRDVDQIIRDLVEVAVTQMKAQLTKKYKHKVKSAVNRRLVDLLIGESRGGNFGSTTAKEFLTLLEKGELDKRRVEIEIPEVKARNPGAILGGGGRDNSFMNSISIGVAPIDFLSVFDAKNKPLRKKKMTIDECRPIIEQQEIEKLLSPELINEKAVEAVEQDGIVFIDEIDKICLRADAIHSGADASSEGVQRDLLPLIEGTVIQTRLGNIDTSKILFVASGAFHSCKPSDLLAELQGRLPIRVELKGLTEQDLYRILTEPESALIKQHIQLMKAENIHLKFTEKAIREIARITAEVNETVENIGARRLTTVLERVLEELSFNCSEYNGKEVIIDEEYVKKHLGDMLLKTDLSRFIL